MLNHLTTAKLIRNAETVHATHALALWRWQLYPWDRQSTDIALDQDKVSGTRTIPAWSSAQPTRSAPHFPQAVKAIVDGQTDLVRKLWNDFGAVSNDAAWLGETCLFFMQRGEEALARTTLDSANLPAKHPLRAQLGAMIAYSFDPPEIAISAIRQLPDDFRWLRALLEAQCLLRMEDRLGVEALRNLWRAIPWHPNLTLKLHGLMTSHVSPSAASSNTAILLYSWNNADLLAQTLDTLAASELGAASVLVLDNGSADHTPAVVQAASNRFGQRLTSLRLPVNIGAPAARNWLLRHPETSRFRSVVFLDDDVLLPRDWLTRLATRYRRAPADSIVGCRIMDQAPRRSVQMADVNLLDIEPDGDFLIANSGGGELDLGLHDYSRPCLSVTGCCHMMDRERAIRLGGFDVRFNPSQFDDFDLDLRNALAGGQAFYAGDIGIMHCQRSSLNQADSEAKRGHIQGNMLKLNTKYTPEQKAELLRKNREMLWEDLLAKTRDLENM